MGTIQLEVAEGYSVERTLPCPRLEYNVPGTVYVVLATPPDMTDWVGTMSPTLKFIVKDCDPNTGEPDSDEGYADEKPRQHKQCPECCIPTLDRAKFVRQNNLQPLPIGW